MKKILFYYLPLLLLLLNSCSTEENKDSTSLILPKKIIYKDQNNKTYQTTTFTYDSNKIVSVSNEFVSIDFVYDGYRIVKEIQYRDNGNSYIEKSYSYSNDSLKTVTKLLNGKETRFLYINNGDGSIKKEVYNFDNKTGKESKCDEDMVFTHLNGNIVKSEYNWGDSYDVISNSYYEYDKNNNVFKNVTGLNLLIDQLDFYNEINISSVNNITRYRVHHIQGSKSTIVFEPFEYVMKYEYNSEGYPIKKTTYDYADQIIEIIEYTY
ncbi:hypothetical protein [Flavobacterium sp.]|uniref:hypothetical protein n=1 Tax=Flavobacterium sp. TaxID=239 RepID=UPI00374D6587